LGGHEGGDEPGRGDRALFARVDAVKDDGTSASTKVTINVLPNLIDTKTPMCAALTTASGNESVPSGPASAGATLIPSDLTSELGSLFLKKAANPDKDQWEIGYVLAGVGGTQGQVVTLAKSMFSLDPMTAVFTFQNTTFEDKQCVVFNGSLCTPILQLKSGEPRERHH
jgi:hypothetical protein